MKVITEDGFHLKIEVCRLTLFYIQIHKCANNDLGIVAYSVCLHYGKYSKLIMKMENERTEQR